MSMVEPGRETRSQSDPSTPPSDDETDSSARRSIPECAAQGSQKMADAAIHKLLEARDRSELSFQASASRTAATLDRIGRALEFAKEEISPDDPRASRYLDKIGEGLKRVSSYVSEATPTKVLHDVSALTRAHPAQAAGGSFFVGLLMGRFLHSSQNDVATTERVHVGAIKPVSAEGGHS
jgi:hypothetical protein